jgi:hypothetical protein
VLPQYVPEVVTSTPKKPLALPAQTEEHVIVASRMWAEAFVAQGSAHAAPADQMAMVARQLRAKARRGDKQAAHQLGSKGLEWAGNAQDAAGAQGFQVEAAPVSTNDVAAVSDGAAESTKEGWDLSGQGSDKDDTTPIPATTSAPATQTGAAPTVASDVPKPDMATETITTAQAKKVSKLLIEVCGSKDHAREWIKPNLHVERSSQIRQNQYEHVLKALTALTKKEGK